MEEAPRSVFSPDFGTESRWVGTALLEIEPRPRPVCGMKHLPTLREARQREIGITKHPVAA